MANQVTTTLTVQTNHSRPAIDAGYLENLKVGYRNSFEKIFAETAPLIRAKFGDWLIDSDVRKVIRAQQENALCANCSGFPCQKYKGVKGFVNIIKPFEELHFVDVQFAPCKFEVQERKQNRINKNFNRSKIPQKYIGKTFEDYKSTPDNGPAVYWSKWFIEKPENARLYFYGMTGCGKTFLVSIIAQELLKKGYSVVFGDVPSLLDDIKSTFDRESTVDDGYGYKKSAYEVIMNEIENADVLILDDIGAEKATDWATEKIYSIVNNRYNAQKAVIVTSNFDGEGLIQHYGGFRGRRIVSRFEEEGGQMLCVGKRDLRSQNRLKTVSKP